MGRQTRHLYKRLMPGVSYKVIENTCREGQKSLTLETTLEWNHHLFEFMKTKVRFGLHHTVLIFKVLPNHLG